MQVVDINDLASAFNKIAREKTGETYPKGIRGMTSGLPGRIRINYKQGDLSSGSNKLTEQQQAVFKKAVKILKENPVQPDFITAFNVLVDGGFEIYPD